MSLLSSLIGGCITLGVIALWSRRKSSGMKRNLEQARASARKAFEETNPDTTPLSDAEIAELERWHTALALPALSLDPAPHETIGQGGSRIGGPLWLPPGERWPIDSRGVPLEFIAQLDFSAMPPLPGFPATGIAQFFVQRSDLYGADFDEPAQGEARVVWLPSAQDAEPQPAPPLVEQPGFPCSDFSPLTDAVRERGVALVAARFECSPDPTDWRYEAHMKGQLRRPGVDNLEEHWMDQSPRMHQVGGYPNFTQSDFRRTDHYADYDRVLLRLTSRGGVQWGDMGEAMFLIRAADLAAGDFSRVAFYWDCS